MIAVQPATVRVGIADDHKIVREGLREFLSHCGGMEVVGECASGSQAIDMLRQVPIDVLILDVEMPARSGIDAIGSLRAKDPDLGILVLSGHPVEQYALKLLRLGANGYLNKQCEPVEIAQAIRTIASGHKYIQEEVSDLLGDRLAPAASKAPHEHLTPRQFQVFIKLARGRGPAQISRELSLSLKTVAAYRSEIIRKIGGRTNSDLAYYAIKHKLID